MKLHHSWMSVLKTDVRVCSARLKRSRLHPGRYVQGYRHPKAFIVTQWPLRSTVNDIWRLVYDCDVTSMVILNDTSTSRVRFTVFITQTLLIRD